MIRIRFNYGSYVNLLCTRGFYLVQGHSISMVLGVFWDVLYSKIHQLFATLP